MTKSELKDIIKECLLEMQYDNISESELNNFIDIVGNKINSIMSPKYIAKYKAIYKNECYNSTKNIILFDNIEFKDYSGFRKEFDRISKEFSYKCRLYCYKGVIRMSVNCKLEENAIVTEDTEFEKIKDKYSKEFETVITNADKLVNESINKFKNTESYKTNKHNISTLISETKNIGALTDGLEDYKENKDKSVVYTRFLLVDKKFVGKDEYKDGIKLLTSFVSNYIKDNKDSIIKNTNLFTPTSITISKKYENGSVTITISYKLN